MDIVNYIATGEEQVVQHPAVSVKNESRVTSQVKAPANRSVRPLASAIDVSHIGQIVRKCYS